MADTGQQWEDYRRQARQLENELELKLTSLGKLGSHPTQDPYGSSDSVSVMKNSTHMFEAMALEAEQLVAKLTEVNDRMAEHAQSSNLPSSASTVLHTLQRHRDILQDYSHELQRTRANQQAHREREDLLGSVRRHIDDYKTSSGLNRRTDLYLKENQHLQNSHRMVDDQISIAIATKENLNSQRRGLQQITLRMQALANRFPAINSLVRRINIKKKKDTIILSAVIAFCVILLLLYQFG